MALTVPPIASTNPAHHGKSEAHSAGVVAISHPLERLEHRFGLTSRNTWARIGNTDHHTITELRRPDAHRGFSPVAQSVVDDVRNHPLEQTLICLHCNGTHVDDYTSSPRIRASTDAEAQQRAVNHLVQIHRPERGFHHPGGKAGRVEQVPDQCRQLIRRLLDGCQQFSGVFGRELDVVASQTGHRRLHSGERRSQVMAYR